jgi:adenylate cyclase
MSFWKELSRRNVIKVGIAYAVAAWLIIHPVDIIFPILHLPEWSITLITAILIILFPLVLIFAWAYEITPKGLKKTKEVPISKSITHLTGKRLNYIIVGLLVVALGYFVFDKYFISHSAIETRQAPAVVEVANEKKSIAVLPFVDLSPEKDQEYFVDGLSEEILNSLAQIQNLIVIARTSSFSFKGSSKTVQEIAKILGVENILEGSVRKSGNALRITAQLVKTVDGSHLWSKTYDRELKDIFAVQEDIAKAIANGLEATLGIDKFINQSGGTDNTKAYELYLVAQGQNDASKALESIDAAIALDPNFALAWVSKAYSHVSLIKFVSANRAASERNEALRAAQRAIELGPNLADAYALLGDIRSYGGEFVEAGLAFRKASELSTKPLWDINEYINHLLDVGYFERADELVEASWRSDPLMDLRSCIIFILIVIIKM